MITQDGFWMQLYRTTSDLKVKIVALRHLYKETPTVATVSA